MRHRGNYATVMVGDIVVEESDVPFPLPKCQMDDSPVPPRPSSTPRASAAPVIASQTSGAPKDTPLTADDLDSARQDFDDDVCDVCRGGESLESDVLMCCEQCNVWVHQTCYGVPRVPKAAWWVPP